MGTLTDFLGVFIKFKLNVGAEDALSLSASLGDV